MPDELSQWETEGGYSPPVSDTRQDMTEVRDRRERSELLCSMLCSTSTSGGDDDEV